MKIFISCSCDFYDKVEEIKTTLENMGHIATAPNGWNDSSSEDLIKQLDRNSYITWKSGMLRKNADIASTHDAVLVLNFDKKHKESYIGGSAFLEAYEAFRSNKKVYLYRELPQDGPLTDEVIGFNPIVLNEDLSLIE